MPVTLPFSAVDDVWLSSLLGRPALRVLAGSESPTLAHRLATERVFATAKVGTDRVDQAKGLQGAGFYVVDVLLGFSADVDDIAASVSGGRVRDAAAADRDSVFEIAATAFRHTRFHLDPVIPDAIANRIKAEWAANFFSGQRGDCMLVAESEDGAAQGFLLALATDDSLIIDLIAVTPAASGIGLGTSMLTALADYARSREKRRIQVGTQAANSAAVRFYERSGFRLQNAQYVLHHHGSDSRYDDWDSK